MTHDFTGKVVAVSGGAGFGIGNAIAKAFFEAGAQVTICSRHEDRIQAAAKEIGAADQARCKGFAIDMSTPADAKSFVARTVEAFGRIDILANNAGVYRAKASLEVTEDDFDAQMNLKQKGYFFAAQEAARQMIAQSSGGSIINIGSVNADCQTLQNAVYAAANAGVAQLTKALAREWGPEGIRVNCIQPGSIPTEINYEKYQDKAVEERMNGMLALGRRGTVKNIADAALFLASEAAEYVTGDILNVDGGFLLYSI